MEREAFTSLDTASTTPRQIDEFEAYLNSSVNDGQNNLNVTSTLVGQASDFQNVREIACQDANGETITLNFTVISE